MSLGATSTANHSNSMAFTNAARSFNDIRNTNTVEKKGAANGMVKPAATGNTWGVNSIWSGGATGLTLANTTREQSLSHDDIPQAMASQTEQAERKTGSGSLVESSVSEEYRSWGQRGSTAGRQMQTARSTEGQLSQQRVGSTVGLHTMSSTGTGFVGLGSRAPTVNLSQNQSRQRFASTFDVKGDFSGRAPEQPPFNVYTKFDRPIDPTQRKPDSANGYSSTTPSPKDERRPPFSAHYSRTASMSNSRDGSLPPFRGADEAPNFASPDYSRPSQRATPSGSRASPISAMRNGPYGPYFSIDQIAPDLQQLNLNGDYRPSTTYRPASGYSGYQGQTPATARLGALPTNSQVRRLEDMEALEHASLQYLEPDDRDSTQSSNTLSSRSLAERYFSAGGLNEFQPGQPYVASGISTRNQGLTIGSVPTNGYHGYHNAHQPINQRSSAASDALSYMQPNIQQLVAAQMRNPYVGMYSPYAMQLNPQLMPLMPLNTTGLDLPSTPRDSPIAGNEGLQSALMYEFKSNPKTKRYELKDIFQHIAEFSGDQHGSRFIQTKLETANSEEKEVVFREIEPNALPLMTDVFGNYVIQKFFEHGDQIHKKQLANQMRGQVLNLSLQMYGCRVVQKALDTVLVDQQNQLVRELENHVLKCVKDQNGNHVIQKAIERCPAESIDFIISAFRGQVQHLSIHPYGCRVIQRCLEKVDLPSKDMIMAELMQGVQAMILDQFGNYVVQHIVAHDEGESRQQVLNIVAHGLEGYSKHKFASNVVEKCLEKADDAWRQHVVHQLIDANARRTEGEGVLVGMIKDNFGNYVIQKLLDTLKPNDYSLFLESLHPAMAQAKRTGCGKQTVSIDKKMHRYDVYRHGSINHTPQFQTRFGHGFQLPVQMPMTMAPFVSSFHSAATTPPPLTADTQSRQSSALPSLNGDATEGATASPKGSIPSGL